MWYWREISFSNILIILVVGCRIKYFGANERLAECSLILVDPNIAIVRVCIIFFRLNLGTERN